jgi:uncharacterized phage infection (PIP) family protein YhgE
LLAGGSVALFGVLLAVAAQIPSSALAPLRGFQVHSVTLIVGGLVVFTIGLVRELLFGVRHSLESVVKETARLEQVSVRGLELRVAFDQFGGDQAALKRDVLDLQAQLKSLMELAADPEQTVANFRLAASVDQLGMRLDTYIKEQFRQTQQRLVEVLEHSNTSSRTLSKRLTEVTEFVAEQHQAQQIAMREALEPLEAVVGQASASVDQGLQATARIEARMQSHQSALTSGFDAIAEGLKLAAAETTAGLKEVHASVEQGHESAARLDGQMQGYHSAVTKRFDSIDEGVRMTRGELSSSVDDLRAGVDGVQHRLSDLAQHTDSSSRGIGSRLDQVEQLVAEQHQAQQAALRDAVEPLQTSAVKAQACAEQGLEAAARLDGKVQAYHSAVAKRFDSIDDGVRMTRGELSASVSDLRAGVDGVQQRLADVVEHTDNASRGLGSRLGQVEQLFAEQQQTQQAVLREAVEPLKALSAKAQASAEQGLEAAARLEGRVQGYHNSVTKRFDSIADGLKLAAAETTAGQKDLRACVDREFKQHGALLDVRFASIDSRLDRSERDRAASAKQWSDNLEQQVARGEDLKKRLTAVAEEAQRGTKRVVSELEQFTARVQEHALAQSTSVTAAFNSLSESLATANREIAQTVHQLGAHFDESAEIQQSMTEEDRAALQQLSSSVERLFAHMDDHFVEQLGVVQRNLQDVVRNSAPNPHELETNLVQLRSSINQSLDQRLSSLERIGQCVDELLAAFDLPKHPAPLAEVVVEQPAESQPPPAGELG